MSEKYPVHEAHEQRITEMQPFLETELHGQQINIDVHTTPLMSQEEAVEVYGINGNILATITLPSNSEAKEIAIVDYGEPDPSNPKPITIFEGQPIPMMGRAKERYGLRALNYTPEQHMSSHVGFAEGTKLNIGRGEDEGRIDTNYKLGLNLDSSENSLISRKHATVSIENGTLSIIDHSTNGSLIRSANPERSEAFATMEEIHEDLGQSALQGANVEPSTLEFQRPVNDIYAELASTANKLSEGYIEPSILVNQMKNILANMTEEERESLSDISELVDGIVDKYGREVDRYSTSTVAQRISALSRQRMEGR